MPRCSSPRLDKLARYVTPHNKAESEVRAPGHSQQRSTTESCKMAFVMSALTTAMPTVGVRGNVRVAPKAPAQAVSLVGSMNGSVSLGREGECPEALISPPGTARWRRTRAS